MGWRETTGSLGVIAVLIPALWIPSAHAGNTTCASGQLEWYSSVVGESPCKSPCPFRAVDEETTKESAAPPGVTYERLRQICNPDCESSKSPCLGSSPLHVEVDMPS